MYLPGDIILQDENCIQNLKKLFSFTYQKNWQLFENILAFKNIYIKQPGGKIIEPYICCKNSSFLNTRQNSKFIKHIGLKAQSLFTADHLNCSVGN